MKKLIPLIILLIGCLVFCSCELDISSQLNDISNQIFDIAQNAGGAFLKETTSTSEEESSEAPSDESSSTEDEPSEEEPSEE